MVCESNAHAMSRQCTVMYICYVMWFHVVVCDFMLCYVVCYLISVLLYYLSFACHVNCYAHFAFMHACMHVVHAYSACLDGCYVCYALCVCSVCISCLYHLCMHMFWYMCACANEKIRYLHVHRAFATVCCNDWHTLCRVACCCWAAAHGTSGILQSVALMLPPASSLQ